MDPAMDTTRFAATPPPPYYDRDFEVRVARVERAYGAVEAA